MRFLRHRQARFDQGRLRPFRRPCSEPAPSERGAPQGPGPAVATRPWPPGRGGLTPTGQTGVRPARLRVFRRLLGKQPVSTPKAATCSPGILLSAINAHCPTHRQMSPASQTICRLASVDLPSATESRWRSGGAPARRPLGGGNTIRWQLNASIRCPGCSQFAHIDIAGDDARLGAGPSSCREIGFRLRPTWSGEAIAAASRQLRVGGRRMSPNAR